MKLNRHTITSILVLALLVQVTIITYNYVTGYILIQTITNFITRLSIGTVLSFVFAVLLIYMDLQIINRLDKKLPLPEMLLIRVPIEVVFSISAGCIIGTLVTVVAGSLMPYDDGLFKNIINNSLITSVINIILVTVIEAIVWFRKNQKAEVKAEKLEKENAQIKFETLKSQLNPHFLFNSLNVLSSLIKSDPVRAQDFVEEFSSVYRYTLDVIDKPVVELKDELEFAKSFLFLQKIRFGDAVKMDVSVDAAKLNYFVPSLAIQTLLENAFKHNKASSENPLFIKIKNDNNNLIISNKLQIKTVRNNSGGIGLSNLIKRYELLGEQKPKFIFCENEYTAIIPLIEPED